MFEDVSAANGVLMPQVRNWLFTTSCACRVDPVCPITVQIESNATRTALCACQYHATGIACGRSVLIGIFRMDYRQVRCH
jgi:hypothetical protein